MRRRLILGGAIAVGTAALTYFLPLFHVVPLRGSGVEGSPATDFDPAAFVERFWIEQLIGSATTAADASELVGMLRDDPQAARVKHGRSVGLGGVFYYFVAGTGRVVATEKNSVGLAVGDGEEAIEVELGTGPVFGNALRDGTGLLDVNDFPNSKNFNALSAELNKRVEDDVLPALRAVAVGATVRFAGCAEVVDEATDLRPLRVVPFLAEVR
jgi:predicted lipoprotein